MRTGVPASTQIRSWLRPWYFRTSSSNCKAPNSSILSPGMLRQVWFWLLNFAPVPVSKSRLASFRSRSCGYSLRKMMLFLCWVSARPSRRYDLPPPAAPPKNNSSAWLRYASVCGPGRGRNGISPASICRCNSRSDSVIKGHKCSESSFIRDRRSNWFSI